MRLSPRTRKTSVNLSESISRQLNIYTLAASAAGVGILALAGPAEARIVYTPVHVVLTQGSLALDLNNDGIVDFVLLDKYQRDGQTTNSFWLYVNPEHTGNAAVGHQGTYFRSASALNRGIQIGPKNQFNGNLMAFACSFANTTDCRVGKWFDLSNRFLGLKFTINGKTHYGWARLNVSFQPNWGKGTLKATLTGYAYETIPAKAIIAGATKAPDDDAEPATASLDTRTPEPATLGALAMGAPGLSIWRRKNRSFGVGAPPPSGTLP
jgi:hypothetical protein